MRSLSGGNSVVGLRAGRVRLLQPRRAIGAFLTAVASLRRGSCSLGALPTPKANNMAAAFSSRRRPTWQIASCLLLFPLISILLTVGSSAQTTYTPNTNIAPAVGVQAIDRPLVTNAAVGSDSVTGSWLGTFGHQGDPVSSEYSYEIDLMQDATGAVSGTTTAISNGSPQYFVVWSVEGHFSNGVLSYTNQTVLRQNRPQGIFWCVFTAHLTLSPDGVTFSGDWTWQQPGCGPGVITVTKQGNPNLGNSSLPPPPDVLPSSPANPSGPVYANASGCGAIGGNPINTATGNKFQVETDFVGASCTGLALRRYYNSQSPTGSGFGTGWHSTWHRSLKPLAPGSVIVTGTDGREDTFTLNAGVWQANPDVTSRLAAMLDAGGNQIGWQLVTAADSVETYALAGRLLSVTTRAGLATRLAYDAKGRLTAVTGPFGDRLTFTSDANDRVATMTVPDGGVYRYAYDVDNNLVSVRHPDSGVRKYVYNNTSFPHALTGIIDENDKRYATWAYDPQGRATSSQHAGGADLTSVVYNLDGTSSVTDGNGNTHSYALQTQFSVVKPTSLTGAPYPPAGGQAFTYDANGFIASRTDYDGHVTTYTHDPRGNETSRTEASGTSLARTISTVWRPSFHLPGKITEPGRTTTFDYDAHGNLLKKTVTAKALKRSSSYTYNTKGQVLTATDPLGHVTTYAYDAKGDLVTVKDTLDHVTRFTGYDADRRLTSFTDPNGLTTKLTYNFRGEVASRDVGGELTTYTYDRVGQLTKTTRPDGSFLVFTHDAAHRLTEIRDALGNRIAYTYDAASNITKVQFFDPTGKVARLRSFAYDDANRLAKAIGAAGETTVYGHDPNGNLTKATDPLGHVMSYAYDALNRLAKATDPTGGVTADGYDALDHLTAVTDPRGLRTSYSWNGLDEEGAVKSPDAGLTTRSFDAAGNVVTLTDARGLKTTYAYDALNRPVSVVYADGKTVTWHYDQGVNGIGHLTKMIDRSGNTVWTYDRHGRVLSKTQTTGGHAFTTAISYDAAGRLKTLTYPSGKVVAVSYDAAGRVSALKAGATALVGNVGYQPFGPVNGWTQGNGAVYSRSFDADGRITRIGLGAGMMSLAHDKAGRITDITETGFAAKSFAYDALDRLTGYTAGATTQNYKYDADGNRTALGGGIATTYKIAAASNRLAGTTGGSVRTLSYDAAGNMTTDNRVVTVLGYAYDASGRLVAARTGALTTSYTNNGLGERVSRSGHGAASIPGGRETFVYDEKGHLLGEYDGTGKAIQETVWLGDLPAAVLIPGKSPFYIAPDQLGGPHQIANSSRSTVWHWDHDPFGNGAPKGSLLYNLRFPGQYFDSETGLHYNTFRDYDPATGRYVQSDPIGLQGGVNTYAYAGVSPTGGIDPAGLEGASTEAGDSQHYVDKIGHASDLDDIGLQIFSPVNDEEMWRNILNGKYYNQAYFGNGARFNSGSTIKFLKNAANAAGRIDKSNSLPGINAIVGVLDYANCPSLENKINLGASSIALAGAIAEAPEVAAVGLVGTGMWIAQAIKLDVPLAYLYIYDYTGGDLSMTKQIITDSR
jgi:RHS repeat-associated protein